MVPILTIVNLQMVQVGVLGFSLPLVRRVDREIKARAIEIARNVCVELLRMEQHKFAYSLGYCLEQFLGVLAREETGMSRGLNAGTARLLSILYPATSGFKGLNGFTNKAYAQLGRSNLDYMIQVLKSEGYLMLNCCLLKLGRLRTLPGAVLH